MHVDDGTHVNVIQKQLVKNKLTEIRLKSKKVHNCFGTDSTDKSANGHVVHCFLITKFIQYSYSIHVRMRKPHIEWRAFSASEVFRIEIVCLQLYSFALPHTPHSLTHTNVI